MLSIYIYDYSKYIYVYLMHKKFDILDKFRKSSHKQRNNQVNISRDFDQIELMKICLGSSIISFKQYEIIFQLSALETPQEHEMVERRNQTIINIVTCMMSFSTLFISICGYTLETTICLSNLVPSKSMAKTSMEKLIGHKLYQFTTCVHLRLPMFKTL